ncbi:MAG: carbon storage regulator [Planctomycetia bacterium]|nr:carbon storage regulator [Planctomycetia bacterium]
MLVLSRKESEIIRVGDSIAITVVRIAKDRVRLGIEAPENVLVLRGELEKGEDGEREEEEKEKSSAPERSVSVQSSRAAVPRRTLAEFRRSRMTHQFSEASSSAEQKEESPGNIAVEEETAIQQEEKPTGNRRFFRW